MCDLTEIEEELDDKFDKDLYKTMADSCTPLTESVKDPTLEARSLADMGFDFKDGYIDLEFGCEPNVACAGLEKMIKNRVCTNVVVHIGDKEFHCHLQVLQVYANYFRTCGVKDTLELDPQQVTPEAFETIYDWMCNDSAKPKRQGIMDVYRAATFMKMPELLQQIWSRFDDSKLFGEDQAFKLYLEAFKNESVELQKVMLMRFGRFFLCAVCTAEFLELPLHIVQEILAHNSTCVNSEMEIFMIALRWLVHDWEQRRAHGVSLMTGVVRFRLLPAWFLTALKSSTELAELRDLLQVPEMKAVFNETLSYAITEQYISKDSPLNEPLNMYTEPDRQRVVDERCAHHHHYGCPNWQLLNFGLFNEFLERIIKEGASFWQNLRYQLPGEMLPCCLQAQQDKVELLK